jgi:hypothetical protein
VVREVSAAHMYCIKILFQAKYILQCVKHYCTLRRSSKCSVCIPMTQFIQFFP